MIGSISLHPHLVGLSVESPGVETILLDPRRSKKNGSMAPGLFRRRSRRPETAPLQKSQTTRELSDMSNQFALSQSAHENSASKRPRQRASFVAARNLFCGLSSSLQPRSHQQLHDEPQEHAYPSQAHAQSRPIQSQQKPELNFPPSRDVATAWVQMGDMAAPGFTSSGHRHSTTTDATTSAVRAFSAMRPPHDQRGAPCSDSNNNTKFATPTSLSFSSQDRNHQQRLVKPRPQNSSSKQQSNRNRHHSKMTHWKSAVDPKSGRTYFYNSKTRETQWRKPLELATPEELHAIQVKEQKQKEFFSAMEANILNSMKRKVIPGSPQQKSSDDQSSSAKKSEVSNNSLNSEEDSLSGENLNEDGLLNARPGGRLVRTISAMDDTILKQIVQRQPSCQAISVSEHQQHVETGGTVGRRGSFTVETLAEDPPVRGALPNSMATDFTSSSLDFNMSSSSFLDVADESSSDFGLTTQETHALQKLARTAHAMVKLSEEPMEDDLLDYSSSEDDATDSKEELSPQPQEPSSPDGPQPSGLTHKQQEALSSSRLEKLPLGTRRNSCGTMYVGSTLSAPDSDATIKCVCGVYRAHILSAAQEEEKSSTRDRYRIFADRAMERKQGGSPPGRDELMIMRLSLRDRSTSNTPSQPDAPSLDEITSFYRKVFRKAQMETDTIIMSLIYVERLIKSTNGALRPRSDNWRSILFSCMILSSKVWDDLSMWNADFSQTCPPGVKFPLQRINELEVAVLTALGYIVKVPSSEYAKYYFVLRSMLIKSGLGGDDLYQMSPLDVEGAKRLEQVSSSFQSMASTKRQVTMENSLRSKSLGVTQNEQLRKSQSERVRGQEVKASLEHVVKMSID